MGELSRRAFLKLAAGGGAAAAMGYGAKPLHRLVSFVEPPKDAVPGETVVYATTCRECPAGCGMHAWHRDGRVVKVEGNPDHPINRGGLCARGQSALQGLYDPNRLQHVLHRPRIAKPGVTSASTQVLPRSPAGYPELGPARKSDWKTAITEIAARLKKPGATVRIISDLQTGALAEIMMAFTTAFGGAKPVFYEPFNYESISADNGLLFNRSVIPDYRIDECELVVSFGADFLDTWISPVQFAHRFAKMHAYDPAKKTRGRMFYIGPRFSLTAANADEFFQVRLGGMTVIAAAMIQTILTRGWAKAKGTYKGKDLTSLVGRLPTPEEASVGTGVPAEKIVALARAFIESKSLALSEESMDSGGTRIYGQGFYVGLLNYLSGNIGSGLDFSRSHAISNTSSYAYWANADMWEKYDLVLVHNTNLDYVSPKWLEDFCLDSGLVVYLGTMPDETAQKAEWVLPIDTPLESWGDYEPQAGIHCTVQPAMSRIYDTRAAGDILLAIAQEAGKPLAIPQTGGPAPDTESWLRQRWDKIGKRVAASGGQEAFWQDSLRMGWLVEEAVPVPKIENVDINPRGEEDVGWSRHSGGGAWNSLETVTTAPTILRSLLNLPGQVTGGDGFDLWVFPSITMFDGRTANRSWLQEAPDSLATVQWGTWIDVHPSTASSLRLFTGDMVELSIPDRADREWRLEAPVRVTEDIAEGTLGLPIGNGHTAMGRIAAGRGANAFALVGPTLLSFLDEGRIALRSTGRRAEITFATPTQDQHRREILQWVPLSKLREMKDGELGPAGGESDGQSGGEGEGEGEGGREKFSLPLPEGYDKGKDLYKPREYKDHRWAMVVDLDRCIGCGACAVACQAENNVAVVGPEEAAKGRIMNWLRIVPYRHPDDPRKVGFLPMLCQHCDSAPCEPVCPVFASVHNEEGLNAQVYNRCIGTRYCSHNCPYKVRRFNWFDHEWPRPLDWQLNPEVTVRTRGVMEKCTFCIQRIRAGERAARREGRAVRDGEIQPACAQSCPTKTFTFGDLLDPASAVSRLTRNSPRRYHILEDLNTKPAVTYLRRIEGDK